MGNEMSADLQVNSLASVLRAEIARLDQGEHEMEVVCGDNIEWDIHQHINRCKKNPDHKDFIPVNKLTLEHIPSQWRDPGVLALIKQKCDVTVRLVVRYTSPDRPSSLGYGNLKGKPVSRFGTGWFDTPIPSNTSQPCPIKNCSFSSAPHDVSPFFRITTAAHVIYHNSEARKTVIEFFYDSENDRSTVLKAEGVEIYAVDLDGDLCYISCITHNLDWLPKMKHLEYEFLHKTPKFYANASSPLAFAVSHPHGGSKQVTFGDLKHTEYIDTPRREDLNQAEKKFHEDTGSTTKLENLTICTFKYTVPTCPGSSGAPVYTFQVDRGRIRHCGAPHSRHQTVEQVGESGYGFLSFPNF